MSNPICGIYLIKNNKNGLTYIGQSIDIHRRIKRHFDGSHKDRTLIDCAIAKEPQNFSWEILIECAKEDLNYYENYYIYYYDSLNHGYNRNFGGHSVNILMGEKHPNTKYTDEEVLNIRKEYVHYTMLELYEKYKKNQSFNSFKRTINNSYKHLPIYKKSKKEWYYPPEWCGDKIISKKYSQGNTISEDEIMELRRLSLFYTDEEIFNMPQRKDCKTIRQLNELISGRLYTWLPYFSRKEQKWIYPDNWTREKEQELDELPIFKDIFYKKSRSSQTKLTNYQVIQIRVASLYLSPQRKIIEKLNLQEIISKDTIKLILKNKTHLSVPYLLDGQWIYPANFTQKQKEYFPKLVKKIEKELHLEEE